MQSSYTDPPSWNLFRVVHGDAAADRFQDLCKALFARRLGKKPSELIEYANQPGIEVEPVNVDGRHHSFQAKFSGKDEVRWSDFCESLKQTVKDMASGDVNLDLILHYTNGNAARTNRRRDRINGIAKDNGVAIEWIYGTEILAAIDESENDDLRREYFRGGRDLALEIPSVSSSAHIAAVKFQAELIPFHGREAELARLHEFA